MPKVYKKRKDGFTHVANNIMDDSSISYKAIGLFITMWRKPDDWSFNIKAMAKEHKEGKAAVATALDELIEHGYVRRIQSRNQGKFGAYDYELDEAPEPPQPENRSTVPPQPDYSDTENPAPEKRDPENQSLLNTIYTKDNLTNKTTTTTDLIKSKLKANGIQPTEAIVTMVESFLQTMSLKAILYTIDKVGKKPQPSGALLEHILKDNQKHQLLTLEQVKADDDRHQRQHEPPQPSGQSIPIFKLGGIANG